MSPKRGRRAASPRGDRRASDARSDRSQALDARGEARVAADRAERARRRRRAAPRRRRARARAAAATSSSTSTRLREPRLRHARRADVADRRRIPRHQAADHPQRAAAGRQSRSRNGNLVMVTSALPGEGKTFTSINLAMSIAMELDTTCCWSTATSRIRRCRACSARRHSPGLLDLLTRDDIDVADALVRTNVDKLTMLPAGSRHRRATELLASEQMASLLRELAIALLRTASSFSIRRRCSRRPRRACSRRTWARSSWSSPPTATPPARRQSGARDDRELRDRADDAQQGEQTDVGTLLWLLRG